MADCNGNGDCCYVNGEVCQHRVENVGGRRFACGIVVRLLAERPELANDKTALGDAWDNDPAYVATTGAVWRQLEIDQRREPLSYQCSTWGPLEGQCCFAETPVVIR